MHASLIPTADHAPDGQVFSAINYWLEQTDDFAGLTYMLDTSGLQPRTKPLLVAIGGLPGTGKSTLARELASLVGVIVLRADSIRKHMAGVSLVSRAPDEAYSAVISRRVYQQIAESAAQITGVGFPVVADATFRNPDERTHIEQFAHDQNIPFFGFWLWVSDDIARERLQNRSDDISDAGVSEYNRQRCQDTGAITWLRIETALPAQEIAEMIHERYLSSR